MSSCSYCSARKHVRQAADWLGMQGRAMGAHTWLAVNLAAAGKIFMAQSLDEGESWSTEMHGSVWWCDLAANLAAYTLAAAGKMFMAQSLDKGESWSRPAPTPLPRADFKVATVTIDGQVNVFWGSRDWFFFGHEITGGPSSRWSP